MGINASAVKVLLLESLREPLKGKLLTLGRQDVFVTQSELSAIFPKGTNLAPSQDIPVLSPKPELAAGGFVSDRYLFSILGFSESRSLDASEYEGADYVFDLNQAETPAALLESWDVVFDGGTIEHVFHLPNALANLTRMLKVGGRVIHIAPSSNHIDHGFYMFSPTFFWDYYHANGFDVNVCQVFRYSASDVYGGQWAVSDYAPGSLVRVSLGGLDDGIYGVILIATKKTNSTYGRIPQQGLYADAKWKGREPSNHELQLSEDFNGKGLGLRVKYYL